MFAHTERLMLRPAWSEDAPVLATLRQGEDAPAPALPTVSAGTESVLTSELLVFQRTRRAPRLIGTLALHRHARDADFQVWIARPYWGLGFATEAGRAAIAMAQQSLRIGRLVAGHFADHPAFGRVLRKLNFERESGGALSTPAAGDPNWIRYALDAGRGRAALAF